MGLDLPVAARTGKLCFSKHVKMEDRPIWWPQEKAMPLWTGVAGGCHLALNTPAPANQDADR